jgi:hypothetical protein
MELNRILHERFLDNGNFYPLVPGIKPTDWYNDHIRFKATDNMWEMWHIYHAYKNKYYTLYPNFLRCEGMPIIYGTEPYFA